MMQTLQGQGLCLSDPLEDLRIPCCTYLVRSNVKAAQLDITLVCV